MVDYHQKNKPINKEWKKSTTKIRAEKGKGQMEGRVKDEKSRCWTSLKVRQEKDKKLGKTSNEDEPYESCWWKSTQQKNIKHLQAASMVLKKPYIRDTVKGSDNL